MSLKYDNKLFSLSVLVLLLAFLSSCEGYKMFTGVVVSETNGEPVNGAQIDVSYRNNHKTISSLHADSSGSFYYVTGFTGMMFGGPAYRFTIKAEGFESLTLTSKKGRLDTLYLKTIVDKNQQQQISKMQFDSLVDVSIHLLKTKRIGAINDEQHIVIMMCLNTIPLAFTKQLEPRFQGGRYDELKTIAERKKYDEKIIRVYHIRKLNKGHGWYFPSLQMELGGSPAPYAWFDVGE